MEWRQFGQDPSPDPFLSSGNRLADALVSARLVTVAFAAMTGLAAKFVRRQFFQTCLGGDDRNPGGVGGKFQDGLRGYVLRGIEVIMVHHLAMVVVANAVHANC
jgi:hypothetical protein